MRFERLTVRGGGEDTVRLENVTGVEFDHVGIFSTTHGVRTNNATDTTFAHCRFLGGLPDWFFRSDPSPAPGTAGHGRRGNNPGAQTSRALLLGAKDDTGTHIHHSEFRNGHDLYLSGSDIDFHHNWIDNLDDEALLLDAVPSRNVHVHQNVITRSLSAISFAGEARAGRTTSTGTSSTSAGRPPATGRASAGDAPRAGATGISTRATVRTGRGSCSRTRSSCPRSRQKFKAAFTHFRDVEGTSLHRALNNVFVAVRRPGAPRRAILLIPRGRPWLVERWQRVLPHRRRGTARCTGSRRRSDAIRRSQRGSGPARATSWHGIEGDPGFRRLGRGRHSAAHGRFPPDAGAGRDAGVALPDPLRGLDPWDVPGSPSIGAYRAEERGCRSGSTAGGYFRAPTRARPGSRRRTTNPPDT